MTKARIVHICSVCHRVSEERLSCHPGGSVECDAGAPGDERTLPLFDEHGHLLTRAPKWWVEACFAKQRKQVDK